MVDIAAASSAASQVPIDGGRSSSQENISTVKELLKQNTEDSNVERKEVEADTGPGVGQNIDINA